MIGTVLGWWIERVIRQMQFPHQATNGHSISDRVLQVFRRGCVVGLKCYDYEVVQKEAQSLPWNLRAFFHEGHAMGTAGRSACSLHKQNPELTIQSNNYKVMRFVGYGFWNGVAMSYPIPNLNENNVYWKEVSSYSKYRFLMTNGLGFSMVLFTRKFDQSIKYRLLVQHGAQQREAAFHGVGRVLWFLYLNNFQALREILAENGDIAEPLGIGLGLAIAFTQVAIPDNILWALDEFPEPHRWNLIRGVGIALQVHADNDPECKVNIERYIESDLRDWYEGACQASQEAGDGADWYPEYHELTKRFVRPVARMLKD